MSIRHADNSNYGPLRVLVKTTMVNWCRLAGIDEDYTDVKVTDRNGRGNGQLRDLLRATERRARQAAKAEPLPRRPQPDPESDQWRQLANRAFAASDAALAWATAATGDHSIIRSPDRYRDHQLIDPLANILRETMQLAIIRRAPGTLALVEQTEALVEAPWTIDDVAAYLSEQWGRPVTAAEAAQWPDLPTSLETFGLGRSGDDWETQPQHWHPVMIRQQGRQ